MPEKLGFEAAGGIVEKFLPGVSFPVLINAIVPGILAAFAFFPQRALRLTESLSSDLQKSWLPLATAAVVVLILGGLVSSVNSEFYRLAEGRSWPRFLFRAGTRIQQWSVARLYKKATDAKGKDPQLYNEIWYQLRLYPVDESTGDRYASHPTLIGNILAGYEEYPKTRYGMDSIFYWPRLWLTVEKEQKEEINSSWTLADGLLNIAMVAYLAAFVWLARFLICIFELLNPWYFPLHHRPVWSLIGIGCWVLLGYGVYRVSLPFHRRNGEVFKSLFDLYRGKLQPMANLMPNEAAQWRAEWAYLQYLKVQCPSCKSYFSVYEARCENPQCDADIAVILKNLRETGILRGVVPPAPTAASCELTRLLALAATSKKEAGESPH